jgi:predicted permease
MRKVRALWMRLRDLLSARRVDEFNAELDSHIAIATEEGVRAGLTETEARRRALLGLGGAEQTRQAYSERATLPLLENLSRDVRYALRGFRRNPVFAITAIVTLALGIGATTAVFSVIDRILFRSLPYSHDDQLVSVGLVQSLERQEFTLGGFFYEWRDNQKPFTSLTFERGVDECNLTEAKPLALHCAQVAQDFLPTLGVAPVFGRNFLPEEDLPNGPKVALISDGLWLARFNRSPTILDKSISIDDHLVRIVGVLPKDFEMPRLQPADIVLPAAMDVAAQHTVNRGIGFPMWAFARLKPGVSVREAQAEMDPLFKHTQQWIPPQIRQDFHLQVRSIRDRQMQEAYTAAWVLLGSVLAVLLIACANVASLFSARGAAREREVAVRSALGATRGRLIRQTLTEAVLLAIAGAVAGCLLAEILLRIFVAIGSTAVPFLANARLDPRIILFAVVIALLSAAFFGVMPALEKPNATALISRAAKSGSHARMRRVLVSAQIAISVVLLAGASLLLRSFKHLQGQSLGMRTHDVLTVHVPLTWQRYPSAQRYMDFFLRAEKALHQLPGVTAVAISDSLPPVANSWHDERRYADIFVTGRPAIPTATAGKVIVRTVTPDYFRALQIPIVEGRGFTEAERTSSDHPLVLSKLLASRLFPNQDPVGQHIQFGAYLPYFALDKTVFTVIGVAANVKNAGLAGQEDPEYYALKSNLPDVWNRHTVVLLETTLPASVIGPWIRSQIAQIDPIVPVEIEPLRQVVDNLGDRPRFEAALLSLFACTGLVMAVIGLYGVIAFLTIQRTQEIGVRIALGASRVVIMHLILREGVGIVAIGGSIGIVAALALSRLLKSLLFSVGPHDPVSFIGVTLLLAFVALIATLIPARAAMKVDPMSALRVE